MGWQLRLSLLLGRLFGLMGNALLGWSDLPGLFVHRRIDVVFNIPCGFLELLDGFSKGTKEFRQPLGAEENQDEHEDDGELGKPNVLDESESGHGR